MSNTILNNYQTIVINDNSLISDVDANTYADNNAEGNIDTDKNNAEGHNSTDKNVDKQHMNSVTGEHDLEQPGSLLIHNNADDPDIHNNADDPDICSICRQELEGSITRGRLCNHRFHKDCLIRWLDTKHTCPICRRSMASGKCSNYGKIFFLCMLVCITILSTFISLGIIQRVNEHVANIYWLICTALIASSIVFTYGFYKQYYRQEAKPGMVLFCMVCLAAIFVDYFICMVELGYFIDNYYDIYIGHKILILIGYVVICVPISIGILCAFISVLYTLFVILYECIRSQYVSCYTSNDLVDE
jgi:hypothetical protein